MTSFHAGYLQEHGKINLKRLEVYLAALSKNDEDSFQDTYADIKWLEGKKGAKAANAEAVKTEQLMKKVRQRKEPVLKVPKQSNS